MLQSLLISRNGKFILSVAHTRTKVYMNKQIKHRKKALKCHNLASVDFPVLYPVNGQRLFTLHSRIYL